MPTHPAHAIVGLALVSLLLPVDLARGAAVLIPDHTHRLGSCGASGPACIWHCEDDGGVCQADGPSCQDPGAACALDATESFRGVVSVTIDESPCVTDGSLLTLGLAGIRADGTPFQIADKVIDLCERPIGCTGRDNRNCGPCPGVCSDVCVFGPDCECPPGPVVFMCKDPFSDADPFLRESDLPNIDGWLAGINGSQAYQPLMELIRNDLAAEFPAETGRPVIVDASPQWQDQSGSPVAGRFCVKVRFLREDKPLGVCSDDPAVFCAADTDCTAGTCQSGSPADINPTTFTTVASGRRCSGSTKPCVDAGDCPPAESCADTVATADTSAVCSGAGTPCTSGDDCPGGETCVACPIALCGDGGIDPGEKCDDGNSTAGDGCSPTCQIELCPAAPAVGCGAFTGGFVLVNEKKPGREKLVGKLLAGPGLAGSEFGDPTGGSTSYGLCLYDAGGSLAGEYTVDRAGETCGSASCWRGLGAPAGVKGYRYKDRARTADGVLRILLKAGDPGRSKIIVKGKGGTGLPIGIAATLSGVTGATLQLHASDAPAPSCFSVALPTVLTNDGTSFKAAP